MKNTIFVLLAVVPFLFGCASTTIKTYSARFNVSPVETKDVGKTRVAPDGSKSVVEQQYEFKSVLTEKIHTPDGKIKSYDYNISLTTKIGNQATVCLGTKGVSKGKVYKNENRLEAVFEDLGTKYKAYLKATIQRDGEDPVSCSQTLIIEK